MSDDTSEQNDSAEAEEAAKPAAGNGAAQPPAADTTSKEAPASGDPAAGTAGEDGEGPDFDDAEVLEPAPPPEPSLEDKLEQATATIKATRNKMLRIAADFENFRKRSQREVDDARKRGRQNAISELLPVFDNLERATAHVEETPETAAIVEGLKLVHKQFLDVLGKMGIERINALDSVFDPNLHESIQYLHSEEHPAGIVMAEVQPGYRMGAALLRPAMVVVSRGPEPSENATPPAAENGGAEEDGAGTDAPDSKEDAGDADAVEPATADASGAEPTASSPAETPSGGNAADAEEGTDG